MPWAVAPRLGDVVGRFIDHEPITAPAVDHYSVFIETREYARRLFGHIGLHHRTSPRPDPPPGKTVWFELHVEPNYP